MVCLFWFGLWGILGLHCCLLFLMMIDVVCGVVSFVRVSARELWVFCSQLLLRWFSWMMGVFCLFVLKFVSDLI